MGLDFDKSVAHWSYGGFMRFRIRLAAAVDIPDLQQMTGFGGESLWDEIEYVDDAILPFLHHSDCDGELTSKECESIAPRLREIVAPWSDDDFDKQQALLLIDGMNECARDETSLAFQ